MALMNSLINISDETYKTFSSGECSSILWPIACNRCVLPSPDPPYRKRGLYAWNGAFATATAAAWAYLLPSPTTKLSFV